MIQASSGERSFTVTTESVTNLPIATRNFADLINLTPGVVNGNRAGDSASTGGGANNFMMDGVSTMEPGSNRLMIGVNVESISEVKVLTSSYQAEFGRSSGLQVTAVTKSGTNRFHGSLYDVERNSDWNANSTHEHPQRRSEERRRSSATGVTRLAGRSGKPGGSNKLFFFYAQEFQPRTTGNNVVRFRVPTALERAGDFSQTTDNNGNPFPYIKDPLLTGTCSATNQAACFADGGVLGRIPANRLYADRTEHPQPLPAAEHRQCPGRPVLQLRAHQARTEHHGLAARRPDRLSADVVLARHVQVRGRGVNRTTPFWDRSPGSTTRR